jgi:hypothetical protein
MLELVLMFLKSAWFSGPEKGRFGVAEFSSRSVSAGSRTAARGQCRRPTISVAACGVLRVRVAYAGRVDCLWCVELLLTPVRAAAVMNSRRGQSC